MVRSEGLLRGGLGEEKAKGGGDGETSRTIGESRIEDRKLERKENCGKRFGERRKPPLRSIAELR